MFKNTVLLFVLVLISCGNKTKSSKNDVQGMKTSTPELMSKNPRLQTLSVGANQTALYLPLLKGKRVGVVANQTSVIFKDGGYSHLVDSLLALNVDIKAVFAPEHGFRGTADAGELIKDGLDTKTGLPIVSLYGDNKKPKLAQLKASKTDVQTIEKGSTAIDIMLFDLQDVGARFYTYISTLHYIMEACAEANIPLIILDRPNPNGDYIDGPILEPSHKSFVGMHPIPVVYGMTIGEYGQMINGEQWLENGEQCKLTVIPIKNYTHQTPYSLPIKPSPNLPNDAAINLYPSLCFFEGTNVSVGRGTTKQFQIFGSPYLYKDYYTFKFVPQPNEGAKNPPHKGMLCFGEDLSNSADLKHIDLSYLIEAYNHTVDAPKFFNSFFIKLAGTPKLQQQIEQGLTEKEIKATWAKGIETFKKTRSRYLIYK